MNAYLIFHSRKGAETQSDNGPIVVDRWIRNVGSASWNDFLRSYGVCRMLVNETARWRVAADIVEE